MSTLDQAWKLVHSGGPIDAEALFSAVVTDEVLDSFDPRTRLLVRDSLRGVRDFWGPGIFDTRVRARRNRDRIAAAIDRPGTSDGFSTIKDRLMNATDPHTLLQMLRELGAQLTEDATLTIGGSLALMLDALIVRHTDDVDELPAPLRHEHDLLQSLATRYGLQLAHFQSHYLPEQWNSRTRSLGQFGRLAVRVVDPIDVLAGKLFSRRTKDLDDFRLAWPKVDQSSLRDRIASFTSAFRRDPSLCEAASRNWYIVTGENELPGDKLKKE